MDQHKPHELDILPELLGFNLRRIQARAAASWRETFRVLGLDITPVQGGTLLLIDRHHPTNQRHLAGLLSVEPPSMQEVLAPLIARGYVERRHSENDKRVLELVLTRSGKEAVVQIRRYVHKSERDALALLSEREVRRFLDLLRKAAAS